jgi:hypothetical protein
MPGNFSAETERFVKSIRHLVARPRAGASVGLRVVGDEPPAAGRNVVRPKVAQIAATVPAAEQIDCLKLNKKFIFFDKTFF